MLTLTRIFLVWANAFFENVTVIILIVLHLAIKLYRKKTPPEISSEGFEIIEMGIVMKCSRNSCAKQA